MSKTEVGLNQFEGCLLGVLAGDCLGLPFETYGPRKKTHGYNEQIESFFVALLEPETDDTKHSLQYSDDTSMTMSMARSLIKCKKFEASDMAKLFSYTYLSEAKDRGYGPKARVVLKKLKSTNFQDVFKPASELFSGQGSMGNGSGMRASPVALWTIRDTDLTTFYTMAVQTSRITHTHPRGVVASIFQALAVRHALLHGKDRTEVENPFEILNDFERDFETLAAGKITLPSNINIPSLQEGFEDYRVKLKTIRKLLLQGNETLTTASVVAGLGNKVTALESVPTAFFCFLAAFKEVPFIKTQNQFERTIQLVISMGGDTDTIGAMAGGIAGAYLGSSEIPPKLLSACEDFEGVTVVASQLYDAHLLLGSQNTL